ncbi:hypothetical protein ACTG1J_20885, partial [Aeromonas veronii]
MFSSLSQANCYIVLERERGRVAVGETVTVEPLGIAAVGDPDDDDELLRYNRRIILKSFDFEGQEALKQARVLVIG